MRIILTPFIVYTIIHEYWAYAFALLCIAGLTDVLDGFLARRWNCQTVLGATLDPVADKILLIASFATCAFKGMVARWFFVIITCKEIVLMAGVCMVWLHKSSVTIAPTRLAKITTFAHILFVVWIILSQFLSLPHEKTYWMMMSLLLCLTGAVFMQYAYTGWLFVQEHK